MGLGFVWFSYLGFRLVGFYFYAYFRVYGVVACFGVMGRVRVLLRFCFIVFIRIAILFGKVFEIGIVGFV